MYHMSNALNKCDEYLSNKELLVSNDCTYYNNNIIYETCLAVIVSLMMYRAETTFPQCNLHE